MASENKKTQDPETDPEAQFQQGMRITSVAVQYALVLGTIVFIVLYLLNQK